MSRAVRRRSTSRRTSYCSSTASRWSSSSARARTSPTRWPRGSSSSAATPTSVGWACPRATSNCSGRTSSSSRRTETVPASAPSLLAPKHFLEWRTRRRMSLDDLASHLGKPAATLTGQERLVAGMLAPANLLDIVRHFTLFAEGGGRRYQDRRSLPAVPRCGSSTEPHAHRQDPRRSTARHDRRGGLIWHTQGSGKSLDDGLPGAGDALRPSAARLQGRHRHRPHRSGEAARRDGQALRRGRSARTASRQAPDPALREGPGARLRHDPEVPRHRRDQRGVQRIRHSPATIRPRRSESSTPTRPS